ncbi:hypothetical protein E1B28_000742 [Marasmius oreades]|uniref:Autophagy-related protein 6 n=1 Tax=Marasmius oreades TaxID=181124 RepID=A0A9P7V230_9AGAR|nr:uncharacterized protein E1B28_000742 [Marasmius oreades]KAG7098838.1 hypothetical protein E1B28_000742 [Marasmius oreades]
MSLVCQQCKEPLQLDASIVDLAPSAFDTIVASLPPPASTYGRRASEAEKLDQLPAPSSVKNVLKKSSATSRTSLSPRAQAKQPQQHLPLPNESFVLLQDSIIRNIPTTPPNVRQEKGSIKAKTSPKNESDPIQHTLTHPPPLSHHLRSTARLFNLISNRTDIDHPLCAECTQILLTSLQRQLDETKKERDGYLAFEKEVKKERERDSQGISREEATKKIEKLKLEELAAVEQLVEAERERQALDEELRVLEQEEKMLELEEAESAISPIPAFDYSDIHRLSSFWRNHNDNLLATDHQLAQLATIRTAYTADSATLDKLERTNVYNDAFCIGHDGVFGTINGLRLGRVPGVPVEWAEINAAWGQTLLLLHTIARKLDYKFEK